MKKNTMIKMMALAMALTVAGMPGMSVHAMEIDEDGYEIYCNDGCAHSDKQAWWAQSEEELAEYNAAMDAVAAEFGYTDDGTDGCWKPEDDITSSSSSSEPSYEEPSYDYSSSNDDGGSSESNDGGSSSSESDDGGNDSYNEPSYDKASTDNSAVSTPAVSTGTKKSNVVCVPGCQKWRKGSKATEGQFTVTHCGIVKYQFQLIDKDGNAVSYKGAGLAQDAETGLWYIDIQTAEGVDSTGYGVSTLKGSITYMPELGVTGVMVDGVIVASGT